MTIKLPDHLRFIETDLRTLLTGKINRGKVECGLSYKKQLKNGQGYYVNMDAVTALLAATDQIEEQMLAPLSFSALDVLAFPGIQHEQNTDKTHLAEAINQLVKKTLSDLLEVREREGAQLKLLIEERCHKMQAFVVLAQQRMPEVLQLIRTRLKDKIVELVAQPDFDRLEQELVYLAQKLDITEELDRLNTHITEVLRVLTQKDPIGRRLDFLMQELNREANTLGSKSTDKEMTQIAIELKVLIEQMREQIQNIE
ncbi:MAG: YicC family protein [Methylococcaceae bacterium]|nr:YicC family protein [Methylococcaceae bacterium]